MDAAEILSSPTHVNVDEAETKVDNPEVPQTPEAPKPEEPKVEERDVISPKLAMLAREQKRLQEEKNRFQEERKSPEFQEFMEWKKIKEGAKSDPLSVLEKLGLSYDEITDFVISGKGQKDPSVRALEDKLANLEKERKEERERAEKDLKDAQLNQFKAQIKEECLKDTEGCELINIWGAHNLVYNVIQAHYDSTEEVLPVSEAAKKVEAYLEEESKKYSGSKKLRKLFGAPDLQANEKQTDEPEKVLSTEAQTKTLSNNASSSTTSTEEEELDPHQLLAKATKMISG